MYGSIGTLIVMIILAGLIVSWLAQLIIELKLQKYEKRFIQDMDEKIYEISEHIDTQAQHLQETMAIMNREYKEVIDNASDQLTPPVNFSGKITDKTTQLPTQPHDKKAP